MAQTLICDHVKAVGGLLNIDISKPQLVSSGIARQRYCKYLEDEREKKKTDQEQRRRKHVLEETDELKTKKMRRLISEIVSLTESANKWADKAESVGNLNFICKSNALRKSAKYKVEAMKTIDKKLETKGQEC